MQQGARKITQRGPFQVVGKFLSLKNHDAIPWESQNEEAYCYFLEIDPLVRSYHAQPQTIPYELDGARHVYYPDFRVERNRELRPQVIEVKEDKETESDEFKRWARLIQWICDRQACDFRVVTKSMLFRGARLANIKLLYSYATHPIDPVQVARCLDFVRHHDPIGIDSCFAFLDECGVSRALLYYLLYHGQVYFDIDQPISGHTVVSFP